MATILSTKIILRNDTAANWLKYNPVLLAGEFGVENDTGLFKIGNGTTPYADLPHANSNKQGDALIPDGKTIALNPEGKLGLNKWGQEYYRWVSDNTYELQIVDDEHPWKENLIPKVHTNADGELELSWFESVVEEKLTSLMEQVTELEDSVLHTSGGTLTGDLILSDGAKAASEDFVRQEIEDFATSVTEDGKVNTLMELIEWTETHGGEVAEITNSITELEAKVGDTPVAEQITTISNALYTHLRYEVSSKPEGTLVKYFDKEIRIMCPASTQWTEQQVGPTGDANQYYIGFKAYAPENAVGFREDLKYPIEDTKIYSFENNSFAGVDSYGRKYSIIWLAVAHKEDGVWKRYADNSSKEKYLGYNYAVEWLDENNVVIDSDLIRINLSNEECHETVEPYFMAKTIKEVEVNGTILDTLNNKVKLTTADLIKESEEIAVGEDNSLTIKQVGISKLVSDDSDLVLNGGGAGGAY